jgi:hypothetical protein
MILLLSGNFLLIMIIIMFISLFLLASVWKDTVRPVKTQNVPLCTVQ